MDLNTHAPGLIGDVLLASVGHLDLVAVAVSVAAIATLGFVVFFSDQRSATNRAFLWFSLATIAYGTANYFSYQATDPVVALWLLRVTLFTAVWHAFAFFSLFYVFPHARANLPNWYLMGLTPVVLLTSLLTLTPLVFARISTVAATGQVSNPERGPGMAVFGIVVVSLVVAGLIKLLIKTARGTELEKKQARVVLIGAITTFALILTFNFILPVFLNILDYIPLAPIWFLPFIVFSSHAIRKYRLLNTKIIATELLTFALSIVLLIEIIFAKDLGILLLRVGMFAFVLAFGILLIQSVIAEVRQREELRRLATSLKEANERLKGLDRLKSQFLSFASHQLRAPLSAVRWQAQMIADGTFGAIPKEVTEAAQQIDESAGQLGALVNEFLDLRKLEEGKMEFIFESADIPEMVQAGVRGLAALAQRKGLALTFEDRTTKGTASVDRAKFSQVITNLIDNSIKYTETGSIKVAVENDTPESILISVADTGHGMSADLIPLLFEQFSRANGETKKIEGTGLGLYIAKQIVVAHQGKIWATSPGTGKGSTFWVKINTART